jgi:alpha-1,2-mannosyltransferase
MTTAMALPYNLLALSLVTLLAIILTPYSWRLLGRLCGAQIKSKTAQRRQLLLERAVSEEKFQQDNGTTSDEEWEKVPGSKTPVQADTSFKGVIGFFHPFCNAGGGGERVLFAAILATQQRYPNSLCVVYTGDHDASKEQIIANVRNRFNIHLNPARVCFLYLSTREYVLPSTWPRFTLLGQSLGSILLAWDAFTLLAPDIFIDTMGYAFTLATCKWLFPTVPTGAYVHYPTISTDMLDSLHAEVSTTHGANAGKGAGLRGKVKQFYWQLFAKLYSWVGGNVDVVMTNSSWTQNHVSQLWGPSRTKRGKKHAISVVYPPCAVGELEQKIPVDEASEKNRTRNLLYIAQFRPEKCHQMIIDAFRAFLKTYKHLSDIEPKPKLILVGSVRDDSDEKRVYKLRLQAQEIKESVEFVVNAKWPQILDYLKTSSVGVNGMWNEHFGIGVVEYQAAGLISVVNDSGGPKEDIVIPIDGKSTGTFLSQMIIFLAYTKLTLPPQSQASMLPPKSNSQQVSPKLSNSLLRKLWLCVSARVTVRRGSPKKFSVSVG